MQRTGLRAMDVPKAKKMLADGKPAEEIAEHFRCPVSTIESFMGITPEPAPAPEEATRDLDGDDDED